MKASKLFEKHIKKLNPDIHVEFHGRISPFLGPFSGPDADAHLMRFNRLFQKDLCSCELEVPMVPLFPLHKYLKAPMILAGLSLPEHGYHAPNENFDWDKLPKE